MEHMERFYDRMDKITETVSVIREQNARMETLLKSHMDEIKDQSARITVLEQDAAKQKGAVIATSAIFGTASGLILAYIRSLLK